MLPTCTHGFTSHTKLHVHIHTHPDIYSKIYICNVHKHKEESSESIDSDCRDGWILDHVMED